MDTDPTHIDPTRAVLVHAPAGEQRPQNQAPRRWVRVVSRLTVGGAVSILVVVGAVKVWSTEAFARATGTRALVATSGSMAPVFDAGDLVVVRTVSPDTVRVGDIVTYSVDSSRGLLVTHRVVRIDPAGGDGPRFVTKGDANATPDATAIPGASIVGRYDFRVSRLGLAVTNFAGFGVLILVAAIVLASAALGTGKIGRRSDRSTPSTGPTHKRETQGREK